MSADIDFLLGISRPAQEKKKKPTLRVRKRARAPYRRPAWYMRPESFDIDFVKLENLHGSFCGCGRRRGEGICEHGLDYEDAYA